jgi:hypothetical protein
MPPIINGVYRSRDGELFILGKIGKQFCGAQVSHERIQVIHLAITNNARPKGLGLMMSTPKHTPEEVIESLGAELVAESVAAYVNGEGKPALLTDPENDPAPEPGEVGL